MDRSLTSANWTPDVVATILGTLLGIQLGLFFLVLELLLPATPIRVFSLLVVLFVAYAFHRIVFHMELEGRRHFQQSLSLIIPATLIFFPVMLLANTALSYVQAAVKGLLAKFNPLNLLGAPTEVAKISLNTNGPLLWTSVLALVLLLPFLIHAIKMRLFRPSWLFLLLIPFSLCGIIYLAAQAIMHIV